MSRTYRIHNTLFRAAHFFDSPIEDEKIFIHFFGDAFLGENKEITMVTKNILELTPFEIDHYMDILDVNGSDHEVSPYYESNCYNDILDVNDDDEVAPSEITISDDCGERVTEEDVLSAIGDALVKVLPKLEALPEKQSSPSRPTIPSPPPTPKRVESSDGTDTTASDTSSLSYDVDVSDEKERMLPWVQRSKPHEEQGCWRCSRPCISEEDTDDLWKTYSDGVGAMCVSQSQVDVDELSLVDDTNIRKKKKRWPASRSRGRQWNFDNGSSFEYDEDSYDASAEGQTTSVATSGRKRPHLSRNELPSETPLQNKGAGFICSIPILKTLGCLGEEAKDDLWRKMQRICASDFDSNEDDHVGKDLNISEVSPSASESSLSSDASAVHGTKDTEKRSLNLDNKETYLNLFPGDLNLVVEDAISEATPSVFATSGDLNLVVEVEEECMELKTRLSFGDEEFVIFDNNVFQANANCHNASNNLFEVNELKSGKLEVIEECDGENSTTQGESIRNDETVASEPYNGGKFIFGESKNSIYQLISNEYEILLSEKVDYTCRNEALSKLIKAAEYELHMLARSAPEVDDQQLLEARELAAVKLHAQEHLLRGRTVRKRAQRYLERNRNDGAKTGTPEISHAKKEQSGLEKTWFQCSEEKEYSSVTHEGIYYDISEKFKQKKEWLMIAVLQQRNNSVQSSTEGQSGQSTEQHGERQHDYSIETILKSC
jgi:hypothetical protein